jgi:PST family polysaccharide transporter
VNYFIRRADDLVIGSTLGPAALGIYSLAYRILLFPRNAISGVLSSVMFPILCRVQDDDAQLARVYLRMCSAVALIASPIMLGIAAVAAPFVEVVLGDQWLPCVPLVWIFAPIGMIQAIVTMNGQLYLVKGRADIQFRVGLCIGVCMLVGFLIGVRWGVMGVAVAYGLVELVALYPCLRIAYGLVANLSVRKVVLSVSPYAGASVVMAMLVLLLQEVLRHAQLGKPAVLMSSVALGVVVYLLMILWMNPPAWRDALRLLPVLKIVDWPRAG